MVKRKVSELEGATLDYWAAKAGTGSSVYQSFKQFKDHWDLGICRYSTDWSIGGPIIEREAIGISKPHETLGYWTASIERPSTGTSWAITGQTPLIAAMRCYVAYKFRGTVETED